MSLERRVIHVKVVAGARKTFIKEEGDLWKIYLQTPPVDGKANKALIALLAERFDVSKSQIEIIKGLQSPIKTISIYAKF